MKLSAPLERWIVPSMERGVLRLGGVRVQCAIYIW